MGGDGWLGWVVMGGRGWWGGGVLWVGGWLGGGVWCAGEGYCGWWTKGGLCLMPPMMGGHHGGT